jgi:cysteine dioxygenase
MNAIERIQHASVSLTNPTPLALRDAVRRWEFSAADLVPYLPPPSVYPYGRRVLFRSDCFEVLVMNWLPGRECAPHDHGQSWGWFFVLEGVATHSLYRLGGRGIPVLRQTTTEQPGRLIFAPRGRVHSMGNPTSGRLVTLHAYAPPIVGMKVYDLHRCAACVVSEECGAWWPDSQRQLVRQIRLGPQQ